MGQLKRQLLIWGAIATTTAALPGLALADNVSPDHGGGRHGRGHRNDNAKLAVAGRASGKGDKDSYGLQIRGRSEDKPTDASGLVRFAHKGDGTMEGLVGEITCLSKDDAGVVSATGTIKRSGKRTKGDRKSGVAEASAPNADDEAFLDEVVPWEADELADLSADESAEPSADNPSLPGAPTAPGMPAAPDPGSRKDPGKGGHDHSKHRGELAGKDFALTIDVGGKPQHFSQPKIGEKGTLAACSGGGDPVAVTRGGFKTREAGAGESASPDKGRDRRDDGDRDHRRGRRGWWHR
jgi:hypothetical protein